MQTLNLIHPAKGNVEFKRFIFPDGQPHIKLLTDITGPVNVVARITNSNELFEVAMIPTIGIGAHYNLFISYLMGARMDRAIDDKQPYTLAVVANILRECDYREMHILDPHSEVSTLSTLSNPIDNFYLVYKALQQLGSEDIALVSPDAGARSKTFRIGELIGLPVINCIKHRDSQTGHLDGFEIESGIVKNKRCLIVDDICDGGGTFVGLSSLLRKKGATEVNLAVTHGIFSKGFDLGLDHIYSTDSYRDWTNGTNVTFIPCEELMGVCIW